MPRLIKQQVQLGVPDPTDAYTRVHARLEEALQYLEDLQQSHTRFDLTQAFVDQRLLDKAQLQLAVEDIVCALLGPKGRLVIDP
jgi:hypothetical protein